jgi:site-specific DNA recombinase
LYALRHRHGAHLHLSRNGKIYRCYVCLNGQQHGWQSCPGKSINTHEIETVVADHIRGIGRNEKIIAATAAKVHQENERLMSALKAEQRGGKCELQRLNEKVQRLVCESFSKGSTKAPALDQLADLQDRIRTLEQRMTAIREQVISI